MVMDFAFMPLEVLFLTLVVHRFMNEREKIIRFEKIQMVISTFFSEIGREILSITAYADINKTMIAEKMLVKKEWEGKDFKNLSQIIKTYSSELEMRKISLEQLKDRLKSHRDFLLRLLENPYLIEHETFTDMLQAVFHLCDELSHRSDLQKIKPGDLEHLRLDVARVYHLILAEWVVYMKHLKEHYPYLFSFALRTNPFDPNAQVEIA
jgi:hypothetical protein